MIDPEKLDLTCDQLDSLIAQNMKGCHDKLPDDFVPSRNMGLAFTFIVAEMVEKKHNFYLDYNHQSNQWSIRFGEITDDTVIIDNRRDVEAQQDRNGIFWSAPSCFVAEGICLAVLKFIQKRNAGHRFISKILGRDKYDII